MQRCGLDLETMRKLWQLQTSKNLIIRHVAAKRTSQCIIEIHSHSRPFSKTGGKEEHIFNWGNNSWIMNHEAGDGFCCLRNLSRSLFWARYWVTNHFHKFSTSVWPLLVLATKIPVIDHLLSIIQPGARFPGFGRRLLYIRAAGSIVGLKRLLHYNGKCSGHYSYILPLICGNKPP